MALYETGTATSQEDLMGKLGTFAVANGWTQDIYSTTDDWIALHKGTVYVQFRWDNSTGIAMFHSLGFINTSTAPGNHTNDSGNALVDASAPYNSSVNSGRRVNVGNGPYTAYHFFTDASSTYIHVVLEYAAGIYRHFSFGSLNKRGTWTGGEYAVAHLWAAGAADTFNSVTHAVLWDGADTGTTTGDSNETGTLHCEGLANQGGSSKWGLFTQQTTTLGNDRGGNSRINIIGGIRRSPLLDSFGYLIANPLNAFIPLIPIPIYYKDATITNPNPYYLLGYAPDVCHIQMQNINPGDEFSVGSKVWKVFPLVRKRFLVDGQEETRNCGVAYVKN